MISRKKAPASSSSASSSLFASSAIAVATANNWPSTNYCQTSTKKVRTTCLFLYSFCVSCCLFFSFSQYMYVYIYITSLFFSFHSIIKLLLRFGASLRLFVSSNLRLVWFMLIHSILKHVSMLCSNYSCLRIFAWFGSCRFTILKHVSMLLLAAKGDEVYKSKDEQGIESSGYQRLSRTGLYRRHNGATNAKSTSTIHC